ncbi:hypothetical protein H8957_004285 [Semnopithecus entellus]
MAFLWLEPLCKGVASGHRSCPSLHTESVAALVGQVPCYPPKVLLLSDLTPEGRGEAGSCPDAAQQAGSISVHPVPLKLKPGHKSLVWQVTSLCHFHPDGRTPGQGLTGGAGAINESRPQKADGGERSAIHSPILWMLWEEVHKILPLGVSR